MSDIKININNKTISAKRGELLLDVLRRENILVPTLCHNDEIKPYGACRVCLVEWINGKSSKLMPSCNFCVEDGQSFITDSEKVKLSRRVVLELLLAKCPDVKEIQEMAEKYGVKDTRFEKSDDGCIACGLCIRACKEVVGCSAISFEQRGPSKKVATPFGEEATECIGCGSCAVTCPTNYIKVEEDDNIRRFPLWKVEFEMAKCKICGQKIAPKKQLEFITGKSKLPKWWFNYCQTCRPNALENQKK